MIVIALGANLPDPSGSAPRATCERAVAALAALPGLRLVTCSSWYLSEPEPPSPGAPFYVNGVALFEATAGWAPAALLAALHAVEAAAGRERPYRDAPRSLDLDLIDLDGLVRASPDPVLPHPRAHLRRFVLQPIAEVAPEWRLPGTGEPVGALLAALPGPPLRPMPAA